MCMCAILSLLRLLINIAIAVDILKIKYNHLGLYPEEGPVPKVTDGSIYTSQHSALLEVADHSRCR